MSANAAPVAPLPSGLRPKRKRNLATWAGSIVTALGLGLVLSGATASDVTTLSDAFGTPIETHALPAIG